MILMRPQVESFHSHQCFDYNNFAIALQNKISEISFKFCYLFFPVKFFGLFVILLEE